MYNFMMPNGLMAQTARLHRPSDEHTGKGKGEMNMKSKLNACSGSGVCFSFRSYINRYRFLERLLVSLLVLFL